MMQFQHGWVTVPTNSMKVTMSFGSVTNDLGMPLAEYLMKVGSEGWELVTVVPMQTNVG